MITAAIATEEMSIKYFDTLEYVKQYEEIKDSRALAEFQAAQMESAIETAVQYVKKDSANNVHHLRDELNSKKLATKGNLLSVKNELKVDIKDLRTELKGDIADVRAEIAATKAELKGNIKDLRYDTIRFVIWTGVGVVVTLGGMMGGIAGMIAHALHWF